jgi:hypothetical protein
VTLKYQFVPNIHTRFIADDKREFQFDMIFGLWLDTLSSTERDAVFESSCLNRKGCRAFWTWLGRKDRVPKKLWIYVLSEDIDRMIAEITPGSASDTC